MATKYELYQDKKGEYRWRLRHQNGNIIADSAEGYSSKAGALNGIESVKKNVGEAEIKDLSAPLAPEPAPPPPPPPPKPKAPPAKYELYQDKKGEYRWRLRHLNGNIIADSAEGYSSKAGALNGIESVRKNVGDAEIKDMSAPPAPEPVPPPPPPKPKAPPAKYELYQDKKGEYRWRLRHLNGNIIADSAEGYSSKAGALNGIESVRKNVSDAEIKEITAVPQAAPTAAVVTPPPAPLPPPPAQPVVKQAPPPPQPVAEPAPPPKAPEPIPMPPPAQPVAKQEPEPVKPEPKPEPPPKAPEPIPMPPPQPAAKKEPEPVKPAAKPEPPPAQPAAKQEPPKETPRTFRPGTRGNSGGGDNNNIVAIAGIILAIGFFLCLAAALLAYAG